MVKKTYIFQENARWHDDEQEQFGWRFHFIDEVLSLTHPFLWFHIVRIDHTDDIVTDNKNVRQNVHQKD